MDTFLIGITEWLMAGPAAALPAAFLWGMVSVFHATGHWLISRLLKKRALPLNCALVGLLVLGAIKLVPWVGTWTWTVATFIGVGSTLTTKFGRREPWFDLEVPDRPGSPVRF